MTDWKCFQTEVLIEDDVRERIRQSDRVRVRFDPWDGGSEVVVTIDTPETGERPEIQNQGDDVVAYGREPDRGRWLCLQVNQNGIAMLSAHESETAAAAGLSDTFDQRVLSVIGVREIEIPVDGGADVGVDVDMDSDLDPEGDR